ncbi:MAG: hypothetical protein H7Z42_11605 [Roseiflexaceae bacterium]|nr:hypothetical protein [Roseiflexaceae bacterium]
MGMFAFESFLVLMMVAGSLTIVWGVKRFKLPAQITAIAFAITATSWFVFLVTTISFTVRTFVTPSA